MVHLIHKYKVKVGMILAALMMSQFSFAADLTSRKICGYDNIWWGGGVYDHQYFNDGTCKTFKYDGYTGVKYRTDHLENVVLDQFGSNEFYADGRLEVTPAISQGTGFFHCKDKDLISTYSGKSYSKAQVTFAYSDPIDTYQGKKILQRLSGCMDDAESMVLPDNLKDSNLSPKDFFEKFGGSYFLRLDDDTLVNAGGI